MKKNDSSDEEFWNQIELPIKLESPKKRFNKSEFFTIVTDKANYISINPSERIGRIVNNVRLSKQEELKTQQILIRKQTMKEVKFSSDEIRRHYEDQVSTIVKENITLKDNCISLRKKLFNSSEKCMDQEFLITSFRIQENNKYKLYLRCFIYLYIQNYYTLI